MSLIFNKCKIVKNNNKLYVELKRTNHEKSVAGIFSLIWTKKFAFIYVCDTLVYMQYILFFVIVFLTLTCYIKDQIFVYTYGILEYFLFIKQIFVPMLIYTRTLD